jgi:hypothetical protein
MSIANNHLSKHGRFGDTEIAKTSTGDLWHVNKHEKKLIDNYGKVGEDIVDTLGSGTINPNTGLKEQFLTTALAIGQLGLSLYQGAKGASTQRNTASRKYNLAVSALADLQKAQKELEASTLAQKDLTTQKFESDIGRLSKKTSQNLLDVRSNVDESTRKTNLAYSGVLEEKEERTEKRIKEQAMDTSEDLMSAFGLRMGDIVGGFESEKARLKGEKERLEYEKSLYSNMSKQKFLGIF